jgi:hypothetical protein
LAPLEQVKLSAFYHDIESLSVGVHADMLTFFGYFGAGFSQEPLSNVSTCITLSGTGSKEFDINGTRALKKTIAFCYPLRMINNSDMDILLITRFSLQ